MIRISHALGLALALANAQCCKAQEQLVDVCRTHAMGGESYHVWLSPNQRHAISVGRHWDLVIWDLEARCPLHYIENGPDAVAMHPTAATAIVSWRNPQTGDGIFELDLVTAKTIQLLTTTASVLEIDASGQHLATALVVKKRQRLAKYQLAYLRGQRREPVWQKAWHTRDTMFPNRLRFQKDGSVTTDWSDRRSVNSWRGSKSANGKIAVKRGADGMIEVGSHSYDFHTSHSLNQLEVTNQGVLLAADDFGVFTLQGVEPSDRRVFAPHRGHADRLVFSPDGSHLAIMSLGAVRIVDLCGKDKLLLAGTHIATPGNDGPEFWLASHTKAWRWNAATKTEVGKRLKWRGKGVRLTRDSFAEFDEDNPPYRIWTLGMAEVIKQSAWLHATDPKKLKGWLVKQTRTEWLANDHFYFRYPIAIKALAGTDDVLAHSGTGQHHPGGGPDMYLQRLDADGKSLHNWHANGSSDWFVVNDSETTAWIAGFGHLNGIACKDMSEVVHHTKGADWDSAVTWHDDNLLVTDGKTLQVIDPMTLHLVRSFDVPKDLTELDLIAASPDRSHIAIASGSEVRILRLQ